MVKGRKSRRVILRGVGASPGMAMGPSRLLVSREVHVPTHAVKPEMLGSEIRRFRASLSRGREEIQALREQLGKGPEDPADQILASHLMILQDRELVREIVAAMRGGQMNAAHAVQQVFVAKAHYMESLPSDVFRARAADIRDVERLLLDQLLGEEASTISQLAPGSVVVAAEIAPSDTVALDRNRVAAFVTERGTPTSHVTIMARSRGLPAVVGVADALGIIPPGETVMVDGERGIVIVAPNRKDVAEFEETLERERRIGAILGAAVDLSGQTADGKQVPVLANIDRPEDAEAALESGAEGVGLYRTEFFFLGAAGFPEEDVQEKAYRRVTEAFGARPVTIRTMDLGGDKYAALMGAQHESNPFLGLRGIRYCLAHPEIFLVQARAILRATSGGAARVLLPMISNLEELRRARALINQAAEQLRSGGVQLPERLSVGIMIEVPSAVTMSDALAREADFFSIGSNDLIQYSLGVDRSNERVAHLYDALDPAVLRAIDQTVRSAHSCGIPVGSCGEMSGEILGVFMLVGLGVDDLSVGSRLVPLVKTVLGQVRARDLEELARHCLQAGCPSEVREVIRGGLRGYPQFRVVEHADRIQCRWDPAASG